MKKVTLVLVVLIGMAGILKADSWTQKASFPGVAREFPVSFSIGNKGYIGTGEDGQGNYLKDFWEYDPSTNSWTQKTDFGGEGRWGAIGFCIGNKGYIGTGTGMSSNLGDFWEYDPATNSWTQKADFGGSTRWGASGFSIGSKGYIGIGIALGYPIDFWEWDQGTNIWTQKSNFGGDYRFDAVGFSINGKGYISTGFHWYNGSPVYFNDTWEYDTLSNAWTQKANLPGVARASASGYSLCNWGYLGTGDADTTSFINRFKDFWQFDPSLNQWIQKTNVPNSKRREACSFSINNKGYFGLGVDTSYNLLTDFWEYTPDNICPEGIQELPADILNITLYPNPFTDKTTLIIAGNPQNTMLNIFNIQGQKVKSLFIGNQKEFVINRDDLSEGIYFYELISSNAQTLATGKMVVE